MCTIEMFLRLTLLILLSLCVIQFFCQKEAFQPWNKYGAMTIIRNKSNPTKTSRIEYDYLSKNFPYKNAPISAPVPIPPITARQVKLRNMELK